MRIFLTRSFAWTVFCCLLHGISGCSTALVNVNTLDMASTVDDIATRQIIPTSKIIDTQRPMTGLRWM